MSARATPIVHFEAVTFGHDRAQTILENFDWSVQAGESWSILGPSGCGKSTLLYLIAGLRRPQRGHVIVNGSVVTAPRPDVALMLQEYGLLNWYTAARNIELGLQLRGVSRDERKKRVAHWLEELSIAQVGTRYPLQLSGGQRQRVALARLLALESPLQLLDEPLSAVDELTRERLQKQLVQINQQLGVSTITVTHNVEEAVLLGDKVLVITAHTPITHFAVQTTSFPTIPSRDDPAFVTACRDIRRLLADE